jgi:hypothetical protein
MQFFVQFGPGCCLEKAKKNPLRFSLSPLLAARDGDPKSQLRRDMSSD